eukprot:1161841-Pelagomonas_calceolata.AAC.5
MICAQAIEEGLPDAGLKDQHRLATHTLCCYCEALSFATQRVLTWPFRGGLSQETFLSLPGLALPNTCMQQSCSMATEARCCIQLLGQSAQHVF